MVAVLAIIWAFISFWLNRITSGGNGLQLRSPQLKMKAAKDFSIAK